MPLKKHEHINLSEYVALGDSITSGYSDGALYYEGQLHSFANLLAEQFKLIGGGDFKQPLMTPNSVGVGFYGNARIVLKKEGTLERPSYIAPQGDLAVFSENIFESKGPFNNLSAPGSKLISMVIPGVGNPQNGAGNYNPFFTRMASNPATASVLSDALALHPTFFTLFIGNNDVLTYASSGGTMDAITPIDGDIGVGFHKSLEAVVGALTEQGIEGAIANLADITAVPYFTVIPYDGLILNLSQAEKLNQTYQANGLTFYEGRNAFVINDSAIDNKIIRQLEKGELLILEIQLDPNKDKYLTAELPIPKKYMLTHMEIAGVQKAIASYNEEIERIAHEKKLAFVDVYSFTKTFRTEITFDESTLCAKYNGNNIFSLDGLHLNSFGQAFLANIFIKAINKRYASEIPLLIISNYKRI
jgi:lysophospholipase L1-like esterase